MTIQPQDGLPLSVVDLGLVVSSTPFSHTRINIPSAPSLQSGTAESVEHTGLVFAGFSTPPFTSGFPRSLLDRLLWSQEKRTSPRFYLQNIHPYPSAAPYLQSLIWWLCLHFLQHVSTRQTRSSQLFVAIVSVPISVEWGGGLEPCAERYELSLMPAFCRGTHDTAFGSVALCRGLGAHTIARRLESTAHILGAHKCQQ